MGVYNLKVDIEHSKNLHNLRSDLLFLPERMKLIDAINLYVHYIIKNYVVHMRTLKALNNGLILKKVHKVIEFNQGA